MTIYCEWEKVAGAVLAAPAAVSRKDGLILGENDLHLIRDQTLRHQVTRLVAQNRNLHNRRNIAKKLQGQIRIAFDKNDHHFGNRR
jgi:hypothetical protein